MQKQAIQHAGLTAIARRGFPNHKRAHYRKHAETPLASRNELTRKITNELISEEWAQSEHTKVEDKPLLAVGTSAHTLINGRPSLPALLDHLADYILAEDHSRGLKKTRVPDEYAVEERPYIGSGAADFVLLRYYGRLGLDRETVTGLNAAKFANGFFSTGVETIEQKYAATSVSRIRTRFGSG